MEERSDTGDGVEHEKRFCNNSEHSDYSTPVEHGETLEDATDTHLECPHLEAKEECTSQPKLQTRDRHQGDTGSIKVFEHIHESDEVSKHSHESDEVSEHIHESDEVSKHSHKSDEVSEHSHKSDEVSEHSHKSDEVSEHSHKSDEVSEHRKAVEDKRQIFEDKGEFVPGKIAAPLESIFSRPGVQRQKKDSLFLSKSYAEENAAGNKRATSLESESGWHRGCTLSYLEDGDCIDIGPGEVYIRDQNLIFVRDLFKAVILNLPCKSTKLRSEKHSVFFKARSRKSTGDSFEIVEREYVMEFHSADAAEELLSEARK